MTITRNMYAMTMAVTVGIASSLAAAPQDAQQNETAKVASGPVTVFTFTGEGKGGDERRTFIINRTGDEVSVYIDGKEVPEAHEIKHEGGMVLVLDSAGNVLERLEFAFEPFRKWDGIKDFLATEWHFDGAPEMARFAVGFDDGIRGLQLKDGQWIGDAHVGVFHSGLGEPKAMIGLHLDQPSPALRKHLQLEDSSATLVTAVLKGLPAEKAGIEQYDVIVAIDDDSDVSPALFRAAVSQREPGDRVTLNVIQRGQLRTIEVELEEYDGERMRQAEVIGMVGQSEMQPGSRWFVTTPGFRLDQHSGAMTLPDLHKEMNLFIRPREFDSVLELVPNFRIELESEFMQDAMRNNEALQKLLERERSLLHQEPSQSGEARVQLERELETAREGGARALEEARKHATVFVPRIRARQLDGEEHQLQQELRVQLEALSRDRVVEVSPLVIDRQRSADLHEQLTRMYSRVESLREYAATEAKQAGSEIGEKLQVIDERLEQLEGMIRELLKQRSEGS